MNSWMLSEMALFGFDSLQLWIASLILCAALKGIHIKVVSFLLLHQTIEMLKDNNAPWEGSENALLNSCKSDQNCNILCMWRQNNIKKNYRKGTCQMPNTKAQVIRIRKSSSSICYNFKVNSSTGLKQAVTFKWEKKPLYLTSNCMSFL